MKWLYRNTSLFSLLTLPLFLVDAHAQRLTEELTEGWRFMRGSFHEAAREDFNDDSWPYVRIPHDYAIDGPFDRNNDLQDVRNIQNGETSINRKTGRTGGLPYHGEAWYRRTIHINGHHRAFLYFDGAMSEATVYVNGHQVAFQPNGYAAFDVDITPYVHQGNNQLAVRLSQKDQSSRWYPGAGLYRKVELHQMASTYIPLWGTKIVNKLSGQQALVTLSTQICGKGKEIQLQSELYDAEGKRVAFVKSNGNVADHTLYRQEMQVSSPRLWSPESPYLYQLVQKVIVGGKVVDKTQQHVGIRTAEFRPGEGFFLNGQRRSIQGVCVHHDLGMLGTAVNASALRYRLSLLKDMGCDAIRTSHNLPSSLLPQLCDEMGLMLMIEPFDEWNTPKCKNGFHRFFDEWAEWQVRQMVRHFRNHACVILWGIGNEVPNQRDDNGWMLVDRLQQICHDEDSTRSVTVCMDQIPYVLKNGFERHIDIPGINYNTQHYAKAFAQWHQKIILGSETASTVSSRGVYKFPMQLRKMALYPDHQSSSYDVECCNWSNTPDTDFALAEDNKWYAGQFVWTGFDYLGEPTPYNNDNWPSHSSLFGIIDLANIPKDRYYLYRSQWNRHDHTLHILPHWTWPGREGLVTPVMVYTDLPEAELFINGHSQGRQRKLSAEEAASSQGDSLAMLRRYRLIWDQVKYEPGEIRVVAYNHVGQAVKTQTVTTAGAPHHLKITPSVTTLVKDNGNLCFLHISVVDNHDNLCPDANNIIRFEVKGAGCYKAAANGDATNVNDFNKPIMPTFHGQLMAVVSTIGTTGNITFTANADGLEPCTITLQAQ